MNNIPVGFESRVLLRVISQIWMVVVGSSNRAEWVRDNDDDFFLSRGSWTSCVFGVREGRIFLTMGQFME